MGSRNDLGGQVKPFPEVVETLGGQGVVVVLPGELGLDIAAGVEGLGSLDDEQVLGVDIGVLGEVEVLLRDEDALAEEVLPGDEKMSVTPESCICISLPRHNGQQFPSSCALPSARLSIVVGGIYLVNLLAVGLGNQHRGGLLLGGSMLES